MVNAHIFKCRLNIDGVGVRLFVAYNTDIEPVVLAYNIADALCPHKLHTRFVVGEYLPYLAVNFIAKLTLRGAAYHLSAIDKYNILGNKSNIGNDMSC